MNFKNNNDQKSKLRKTHDQRQLVGGRNTWCVNNVTVNFFFRFFFNLIVLLYNFNLIIGAFETT